jgi:glycosyltransferase involved in cell wall biosynthesis
MVVHNQGEMLEHNLPLFLSQPCQTTYEVIVVDDTSTDNTSDVLKQLKEEYPNLYTTFMPVSVPNPSRLRLAMTVGIKAAKGEWIVLANIQRPPTSPEWIDGLIDNDAETVLVYSGRKHPEIVRHQTWEQLEEAKPLLRKAERRSSRGHYGKWQKIRRGLYDAVSVRKDCIFDAVRYFDQIIRGRRLIGLRLHVIWKALTHQS